MLRAIGLRLMGVLLVLLAPTPAFAQAVEGGATSTTDPISQGIVGLVIVLLFVLLAREAAHRVLIVLGAAAVMWFITYLTPYHLISFERAWAAVDINVLLLLASMMAVVGVLKATGFFAWAVGTIMNRARGEPRRVQRLVGWFTAATSAFLDNVTTVIFVTPMATGMSARLGLAPVAILLPMVIASNVGGTATLIGDPPNIMIGSGAHLSFLDFLASLAAPVIVMMVAVQAFSARYYRKALDTARPPGGAFVAEPPPLPTDPLLLRWMAGICLFILIGFLAHAATGMPPAVPALIGASAALTVQDVLYLRRNKPTHEERTHGILHVIEHEIEWPTLSFFFFLFIVVGAAVETGLIATIAHGLEAIINAASRGLCARRPWDAALRVAADLLGERDSVGVHRQHSVRGSEHPDRACAHPGPSRRHAGLVVGALPRRLPRWKRDGGRRLGERHHDRTRRTRGDAHRLRRVHALRLARDDDHGRGGVGFPHAPRHARRDPGAVDRLGHCRPAPRPERALATRGTRATR